MSFSCCHFQCISPSFSLSPTALNCETTGEHSTPLRSASYCREDFSRYFNSCFLLPSSGSKWRAPLSRTPGHILGRSVKSRKVLRWVVWLWHQQCLKSTRGTIVRCKFCLSTLIFLIMLTFPPTNRFRFYNSRKSGIENGWTERGTLFSLLNSHAYRVCSCLLCPKEPNSTPFGLHRSFNSDTEVCASVYSHWVAPEYQR